VTVTSAFGNTALLGSVTVPEMRPKIVCATAICGDASASHRVSATLNTVLPKVSLEVGFMMISLQRMCEGRVNPASRETGVEPLAGMVLRLTEHDASHLTSVHIPVH